MDRRRRAARTVALMSLFTMTDTRTDVPIASFYGDGSDLISLIVGIEPVQDLHGYDNPWPVGGGKNKLRLTDTALSGTVNGVSYSYDPATEKIAVSGTNTNTANHPMRFFYESTSGFSIPSFAVGETYTLSVMLPSTMYCQFVYKNESNVSRAMGYIRGTDNFTHVTFTVPSDYATFEAFQVYIGGTATTLNTTVYFELSEGSTAPTSWTPYSNICPISGWTGANIHVSPTTDAADGTTYSITFPSSAGTVYGGTLDVTQGKLTVDRANIASYNGEQLPSTWISDRDVYAVGTTPTTGAQVVYKLATPIVYDLTPTQVTTLIGTNNIWADTGDIKYIEYNI